MLSIQESAGNSTGLEIDLPGLITVAVTDDEHAELRRLHFLDLDSERVVWGAYREVLNAWGLLVNVVASVAMAANLFLKDREMRHLDTIGGLRRSRGALRDRAKARYGLSLLSIGFSARLIAIVLPPA